MNLGRYKGGSGYDLMMLSKLVCALQQRQGCVLGYYKRNNESLSGNRVLFRTFSLILLTFIPLLPSFPLILLTHTFLYTFLFTLMLTGKANKKRIHWTVQNYRNSTSLYLA
jgi:hypothetical protein